MDGWGWIDGWMVVDIWMDGWMDRLDGLMDRDGIMDG